MSIVSLFCEIHDFFLVYEAHIATHCLPKKAGSERRGRRRRLHASEVMTILIAFHESNYRTLKHFYEKHVCVYWHSEFPDLVSYSRFVQLQQEVLGLLTLYLYSRLGVCSGISFVDSTPMPVCHNRRISRHRVFKGTAERAKNSMGWFYGFKLHLVISDTGALLSFCFNRRIPMTRHPKLRCWFRQAYLAISTQIEAISQKTCGSCSASKEISTWFTKFARICNRCLYRTPIRCC